MRKQKNKKKSDFHFHNYIGNLERKSQENETKRKSEIIAMNVSFGKPPHFGIKTNHVSPMKHYRLLMFLVSLCRNVYPVRWGEENVFLGCLQIEKISPGR